MGMGMFEILNYSFISPKWIENLGLAADDARRNTVVLRNPLGRGYLRNAHVRWCLPCSTPSRIT